MDITQLLPLLEQKATEITQQMKADPSMTPEKVGAALVTDNLILLHSLPAEMRGMARGVAQAILDNTNGA